MLWADLWFFLIFIYVRRIYQAPHEKGKPYIFVANHISYLDAPIIVKAWRQPVRPLGKVEMGRIPFFGFIYRNAIVTVDRSSPENRQESISILKRIIKRGISVVVFPEGTFNTTDKPLKDFYDGAFRVAVETQTPVKPVIFLDAFDRMHYRSIFSLTPGRCRIVYLEEISVEGLEVQELKERVYAAMEKTLLAYKAPWIGSLQDS